MRHIREEPVSSVTPRSSRLALALAGLVLLVIIAAGCTGGTPHATTFQLTLTLEGSGSGTIGVAAGACADSCTFAINANTTVVVAAAPSADSELEGWSGCDEVVGFECTVTVASHRTVTATLARDEGPSEGTGDLTVTFSGLPQGVSSLGHATITFPTGDEVALLESTTLRDVPVGDYKVTAHTLEVCDSVLQPVVSSGTYTVTDGGSTELDITYDSTGLSSQAFKAVIRGIHSNASEVTAYVTVTDEGPAVSVVACVRFREHGDAVNPSIREGNPKDVFVENAPVVIALTPADQSCLSDDPQNDCTIHLGGVFELEPEQLEAFRSGEYYFYVESFATDGTKLVGQIGGESGDLVPAVGGTLVVDIQGIPAEFDGFEVCILGRFDMGWISYGGGGPCVPLADAGITEFLDNYSGEYEAFINLPPGVKDVPTGLEVTGSPATVRPGTVATIGVVYEEPVALGDVAVTFTGLPAGLEGFGHATLTAAGGSDIDVLESTTLSDGITTDLTIAYGAAGPDRPWLQGGHPGHPQQRLRTGHHGACESH